MASDPQSDEHLIAAIGGKDVQAIEVLYDRYRVLAYSLAVRILANPSDAEDVVQESFVNVWRSASTFHPDRSTGRSWLLSIVHHRCIDKLRGQRSRVQTVALEGDMDAPDGTNVWREVAGNLTGEAVRGALSLLPMEQREAIQLAYFQGLTHAEIARRTDVPLGTVKGRMRIGLHKLKSLLETTQAEMAIE